MMPMTEKRRWRAYYNWRGAKPYLGAVDNGSIKSQKQVMRITLHPSVGTVESATDIGKPKKARTGKLNEPTWWLEFEARACFESSGVTFYGEAK